MNYLKRLKDDNTTLEQGLREILAYVQSRKFDENQYVHRNDIVLRCREIISALN